MSKIVAVGFGVAQAFCDDEIVADGERGVVICGGVAEEVEKFITFGDVEEMALLSPDSDWRIVLHGPLHGETYQRTGPSQWVCIERNEGFA